MSIGDSMKRLIGIEDLEEEEITEEEVQAAKEKIQQQAPPKAEPAPERRATMQAQPRAERRFTVTSTNAFKLVLLEPKTFEECPKLVDSLKGKKPVIINLERLETDVARKIFDFLSGATYALDGNVQKVANNIFIFAPANVDIAGGQPEEKQGFDFTLGERATASTESPWR